MEEEKLLEKKQEAVNLVSALRAIIKLLPEKLKGERGEELILLLTGLGKQIDSANLVPLLRGILSKTLSEVGGRNAISALSNLRLGRIAPYLFISMWEVFGEREAVVSGDKRFTFKEYKERVFRLANGLLDLGVRPLDRVSVLTYNGNEFAELFGADSLIGALNLDTNWHMKADELLELLKRMEPKVLVFEEEFVDRILSIKDQLKSVEDYIVVGEKAPEGMILYEDLLARSSDEMPEKEKMNFVLSVSFFTGGTTGLPKHVPYYKLTGSLLSDLFENPKEKFSGKAVPLEEWLRYLLMIVGAFAHYDCLQQTDEISHGMRTAVPTPLYHAGTAMSWLPTVLFGGTLVTMRKYDPEEFLRLIEKERISFSFVTPTILKRVLDLPEEVKRKYDLSSMYTVLCAAAPCLPEVKIGINELFTRQGGRPVYSEYYASTEDASANSLVPKDYIRNPKRIESCGKSGRASDIVIYDEEKEEVCLPNKEGGVYDRGFGTIPLMYGGVSDEKTKQAFRIINGKEYFDEELIGYLDEDGFLYLTGRKKDIIIPGGVNIYADEIERVLLKNPKVADAAAIPIPDEDLGEVVGAVLELKEGKSATEEEIIEWCKKEGLYGLKVPRKVDFLKELPRTEEGKMLKREIIPKYWEEKGIKRRG